MERYLAYIRIAALIFLSTAIIQAISPNPLDFYKRSSYTANATLSRDGTLRVMGGAKGDYCIACDDFAVPEVPYNLKDSVIRLVIEEDVSFIESIDIRGVERYKSLMSIEVAAGNTYYSSEDGVLFNKNKTVLIRYPPGKQGAYTIPNSVTEIGKNAFYGSIGLTSVTISNSVTSIGEMAFYGSRNLTSVTIPNSVTTIEKWAFGSCFGLKSITIPNSITDIKDDTFSHCTTLTSVTIPSSVMFIECRAFVHCTGLKSITVQNPNPYFVTNRGVFSGVDTKLICLIVPKGRIDAYRTNNVWNEFQIVEDTVNYSSKKGVLFNKDRTELIRYPEAKKGSYKIPNSVTKIGHGAFVGCTGIKSVTIPTSVIEIRESAFFGCTGLKSVTIPTSVTEIGKGAFFDCTGLKSVTIPNSVAKIEDFTFYGCTGLKSVTIPTSVTEIGECAFFGCTGLKSVTIPNSIISTGDLIFGECTGLKSVTIPNSVTSIRMGAFYGCTGLKSIAIPTSVTEIGDTAFYGCTGLKSIAIPNGVTKIGKAAFYGCTGLKSVTIPTGVTEIGKSAFDSCDNLTSIIVRNPTPPEHISNYADERCVDLYVPKGSVEAYRVYMTSNYMYEKKEEPDRYKCGNNIKEIPDDFEEIPDISESTNGNRGIWVAMCILSALVLSVAVFVVTKKTKC
jgi:hypothetical protein